MKCQHEGCLVDVSYLICEIKGAEKSIYRCPNHTLIDLKEIKAELLTMNPIHEKCNCCENMESFKVKYGNDDAILLCLEDVLAYLELRLEPAKFKMLYKKYPNHYMLHDDFYDPITGEAFQPRNIL